MSSKFYKLCKIITVPSLREYHFNFPFSYFGVISIVLKPTFELNSRVIKSISNNSHNGWIVCLKMRMCNIFCLFW